MRFRFSSVSSLLSRPYFIVPLNLLSVNPLESLAKSGNLFLLAEIYAGKTDQERVEDVELFKEIQGQGMCNNFLR
jgi:hypothetical protein